MPKRSQKVYREMLDRAVVAWGGVPGVAQVLDVPAAEVSKWLAGAAPIPPNAFLRLIDSFNEQPRAEQGPATLQIASRRPRLLPIVRDVADRWLEEALALHETTFGTVQLVNARGNLELAAQRGFGPQFLEFFREVSPGDSSVCGQALARGERVVVPSVLLDPVLSGTEAQIVLLAAGVRSVQSTPLVSATRQLFGMISTHFAVAGGAHEGLPSLAPIARQFAHLLQAWTA